MSELPLLHQVAIVTGAGRGIGRGVALALAAAGADVVVHYHESADLAQATAAEIRNRGRRAALVAADLQDPTAAQTIVAAALAALGRLDILVNNAAIFADTPALEIALAEWERVQAINLRAPFLLCQAAAREMLARQGGVMVNIASGGGISVYPGYETGAHYAAAKAGLVMVTKRLAREWAPRIRVNCLTPGIIDSKPTPMPEEQKRRWVPQIPLARVGTLADIANVVVFLCTDQSAYITGQVINVDGGIVMR